jgi:transcriptional regulator with XRE-family HTH domain
MEKITFKEYVTDMPSEKTSERAIFIKKIAKACGVNESTVYRWLNNKAKPSLLAKQKISEITNIPINNLFS